MADLEAWVLSNLGEISLWLSGDRKAARSFTAWYNKESDRLVPKPAATVENVQATALYMFELLGQEVASRG